MGIVGAVRGDADVEGVGGPGSDSPIVGLEDRPAIIHVPERENAQGSSVLLRIEGMRKCPIENVHVQLAHAVALIYAARGAGPEARNVVLARVESQLRPIEAELNCG